MCSASLHGKQSRQRSYINSAYPGAAAARGVVDLYIWRVHRRRRSRTDGRCLVIEESRARPAQRAAAACPRFNYSDDDNYAEDDDAGRRAGGGE